MFNLRTGAFCLALSFLLCTAGAEDAQELFESIYGKKINEVSATASTKDDARLAGEILKLAQKQTDTPELLEIMCEHVYKLGMRNPEGYAPTVEAMELLAKSVLDRKSWCIDKLIDIRQKQYAVARGAEKNAAGAELIKTLIQAGDDAEKKGRLAESINYYYRASNIAKSLKSIDTSSIRDRFSELKGCWIAERKIERYKKRLAANPDDNAAARELVRICLVELDDPARAAKYLNENSDEVMRTYIPLASRDMEKLSPTVIVELGNWYRSLSDKAPHRNKPAMLRRAYGYYSHYLQAHKEQDLRYEKAKLALESLKVTMKRLGVELPGGDAHVERVDPFVGEYQGKVTFSGGRTAPAAGQFFAEGVDKYKVLLLPGQNVKNGVTFTSQNGAIQLRGRAKKGADEVKISGGGWSGTLNSKALTGSSDAGKFRLEYTVRTSPDIGAEPPAGATVLLPYKPDKETSLEAWKNKKWKILPDGSVQVAGGDNTTNKKFGSAKLHVEFYIPFEPKKSRPGRGDSGVYVLGRYEVQVLDSFGTKAGNHGCGSIYDVRAPNVNACLPPGRWQSYDIVIHAARLSGGNAVTEAIMTVRHNGILIHEDAKIKKPTKLAQNRNSGKAGPMVLQDRGNPVRYRNIWLIELNK